MTSMTVDLAVSAILESHRLVCREFGVVLQSLLRWSFTDVSYSNVPVASSGIYAIWSVGGDLEHLGIARDLRGRIRTHARINRLGPYARWNQQISTFQQRAIKDLFCRRFKRAITPETRTEDDKWLSKPGLERRWELILRRFRFAWIVCAYDTACQLEGMMGWK